ncbi:MAG: glutamine-hydrolyzing carbamoyl-phosphate synthase small subunit [Buchnera aphidicola (Eriosoma harunire)]
MKKLGILVLSNGHTFKGYSIGASGTSVGEVVFNTSMTGYQEILTDPSYTGQIITFTSPNIGNVGVNPEDEESEKIHAKGVIIRNLSLIASNYKSHYNLYNYLKKNNIIAISNVDTRKLTHILRNTGSQNGCITTEHQSSHNTLEIAKNFMGLKHIDLVKQVSTKISYNIINKHDHVKKSLLNIPFHIKKKYFHVVVYDFGVKKSILNMLLDRHCYLTVVPATTTSETILKLLPDGIFFSNGPGDPRPCTYVIKTIQHFLTTKIPMFGICLGHQLLALASGAKIIKMKFGHHGGNHPVKEINSKKVIITTQNHGFTVDKHHLPSEINITHVSLFDNTIQGIQWKNKPIFGFQGHPEANPGPHDASSLFDKFINYIKNTNRNL